MHECRCLAEMSKTVLHNSIIPDRRVVHLNPSVAASNALTPALFSIRYSATKQDEECGRTSEKASRIVLGSRGPHSWAYRLDTKTGDIHSSSRAKKDAPKEAIALKIR